MNHDIYQTSFVDPSHEQGFQDNQRVSMFEVEGYW